MQELEGRACHTLPSVPRLHPPTILRFLRLLLRLLLHLLRLLLLLLLLTVVVLLLVVVVLVIVVVVEVAIDMLRCHRWTPWHKHPIGILGLGLTALLPGWGGREPQSPTRH